MDNIARELRNVQEKYKDAVTDTFGVRISDMAKDCADTIESLQAELQKYKQAEVQREKGCEYCKECEPMCYGEDSLKRFGTIYLDGNLLTADLYADSMACTVCYCPICGRKLEV